MKRNPLQPAPKKGALLAIVAIPIVVLGGIVAIFALHSRISQEAQRRLDQLDKAKIEKLFKRLPEDTREHSRPRNGKVYVLVDAQSRAREHPTTFQIPTRDRRESCKSGDLVKVIMEVPPGAPLRDSSGERPWLIIQDVKPGPRFSGKLDNDLVVFPEVPPDELIEFGPEHIVQLWEDREKK